jgi:N-methylhydantoinase B
MSEVSAVLYEVIRSRLLATTEEMRIALQSVSGSPTVTDASDFFTGLFLQDGAFASMGFQVTYQAPVVGHLIKHINRHPSKYPVRPGDMFLGNDPFVGALHQNDVQMAGPIFAGDEIVAWAGVEAHETDVGGMDFASWSPKARDVRQEGFRVPCVKLVEGGTLREDFLDVVLTASRLPSQLGLDIRAFIATLNVAQDRIAALCARYGAKTIAAVMRRMIDASEKRIRARLRELPDGVYRACDFLEHDGHDNTLFKIDLELTKVDDGLRFDFSRSSPQARGFINCTRSGLEGGVAGALLPMLAYDVPWNDGVLKTAQIDAPEGLICTATFPSPVGAATVESIWVVSNVAQAALNKMLAVSERYRDRAQAVSDGTMATFNLGGINQFGEPFGLHLMDPLAGGYAAFATRDGIDAGGPINAPMPSIADVERNEQVVPLFYLHRRLAPDSGGAGQYRGGRSAEVALTLSGVEQAEALIMTHGAEVPNTQGAFGGWPGGTVTQAMGWGAVRHGVAVEGRWESFGPKPGLMTMTNADVFAVTWQGGGGWGDPLDRDPDHVLADVRAGAVSTGAAEDIYGVCLEGLSLDKAATEAKRRALRMVRLNGRAAICETLRLETLESVARLGPNLCVVRDGGTLKVVSAAGAVLSSGSTRWREGAVKHETAAPPWAHKIRLHADLRMTSFYCPRSGALLAVDVHGAHQAPLDDIELDLSKLEKHTAENDQRRTQ